jgi:hypothetical protein
MRIGQCAQAKPIFPGRSAWHVSAWLCNPAMSEATLPFGAETNMSLR